MLANALKYGPTFTAIGMVTAARTRATTSRYCSSTSDPVRRISVGM